MAFPVVGDDELRRIFLQAVAALGDEVVRFALSDTHSVKAEWNGYQRSQPQRESKLSERQAYDCLLRDVSSEVTVLYIHGGGYMCGPPITSSVIEMLTTLHSLGSSSASRGIACGLAGRTGGRVCSLSYRLSPQHPFPAALYDVFVAYLSLIYPPPGSFHTPVPAPSLVLAGDSTGGALCLAFNQLLHFFRRNDVTHVPFHDSSVPLLPPASVAVMSAYCDHTDALPSYINTSNVDYSGQPPIYNAPGFPACSIWPTHPHRTLAYCEGLALCHPLISPAIADDWTGSPPLWFACGEESVVDGSMVIASRAAEQGVAVVWEEYEGMPHIFPLLPGLGPLPQVKRCLEDWGDFCCRCVAQPESLGSSRGVRIGYNAKDESPVNFRTSCSLDFEEVKARMRKSMVDLEEPFQNRQRSQTKL